MKTKLPNQVRFLLADAIREETGGKLTLMGLYSGDEVILQGDLPTEVPQGMKGIALQGLSILAVVVDGCGKFRFRPQLYDPNGDPVGQSSEGTLDKARGVTGNIISPITPFPVPAFGRYRFVIHLDNRRTYEYSFTVRHRDPNARLPAPSTPGTIKKKNSRPKEKRARVQATRRSEEKKILK